MTSRVVIDSSVTMAWCFDDEESTRAVTTLKQIAEAGMEAVVPAIWPLEVSNVLLVGERRGRITAADSAQFVRLLGELPITIDEQSTFRALEEVLSLARRAVLSSYDAAYLDLAMRVGCPLSTLDSRLHIAAAEVGVALLDE